MTTTELKPIVEAASKLVRDTFYHGREVSNYIKANDPVYRARFANALRSVKQIVDLQTA